MINVWCKEIAMMDGNQTNSLSFYRCRGPYTKLHRLDSDIQVTMARAGDYVHHSEISEYDVAVMQRPIANVELRALTYFKRLGIPVIVDYDDNLFDVPESNATYGLYSNKETRECIVNCLGLADVVTTTNENMKAVLSRYSKNVRIVPNAIDDYLFKYNPLTKRNKIVSWRGANGHEEDVWHYKDQIVDAMKAHPDWKFYMFGSYMHFMKELLGDQFVFVPPMDIYDYMEALRETAAAVHIVPLKDTPFNRCKSNISMMEGAWAGSFCLGNMGMIDFAMHNAAFKNQELLLLSEVNPQRVELIKELVNG